MLWKKSENLYVNIAPATARLIFVDSDFTSIPGYVDGDYFGVDAGESTRFEFGGAVSGNTLYFVSARNKSRKKYGWNEQPTLDIYKAVIIEGTYKEPELVKGEVNTKYNEGSVAISSDGNRMYFTRNQYLDGKYGKDENGVGQLQLYFAENVNGTWKDVKSVPFLSLIHISEPTRPY